MHRRHFLSVAAATTAAGMSLDLRASESAARSLVSRGAAEHCVMLWLGGGMAQMDTFDPKAMGDPKAKKAGSYYPAIDTAVPGVQVCEHLSRLAPLMDRVTAVRGMHHDVIDEHAAAVVRVHTGRPTAGTIRYPSIGSLVAHERGAATGGVPAYVVVGYPSESRGPGYLGPKAGYLYCVDPETGPPALQPPPGLTEERTARRQQLLREFASESAANGSETLRRYEEVTAESRRLASGDFLATFDLASEPGGLRDDYGSGLGQRCLLARRLIERGVRFVEVSHNLNFINGSGWDTHKEGQLNQHLLIREVDAAVSALMSDLDARGLLDKTLIVIGTEFGRPAQFDGQGGRGHHGKAFSLVLAGGGLRHRGAWGVTDDLAMKVVEDATSVPDFHATIAATLGIDPGKSLYDGSGRPIPITDGGQPIAALFA